MMKLATCSGSGDAWTFIGCFGSETIQQECFEEGDCLDDAEDLIKDIGYEVADIFGW